MDGDLLPGFLTFWGGYTTLTGIINRVATVGDEAVSDNDQRPTESSRGHPQIAGTARFDALLNELRALLTQAFEPDSLQSPAPMLRRASAHV
jgi:hypothetical protein